uniref:DUF3800 domain-containing protein n=1 Tax=Sphingomonas sp. TaxID=28214 RepID=UPI0025F88BFB
CEKSKAQPQVTASKSRFYKIPWYFHCKHRLLGQISKADEITVVAASIGTKKEKITFIESLEDIMSQNMRDKKWAVDFRPCQADPCLQVADYCAWAIQRKWELNDTRSYNLIARRITREYDLWERGANHHY